MKKKLIAVFCFFILFQQCTHRNLSKENLDLKINLRWVKSYKTENQSQAVIGLKWALSYLGANLPVGAIESGINWQDDALFELDIEQMGFSTNAQRTWHLLLKKMRQSEEYQKMGGIDLGRFIMLTLNSSNHYYAITEIPRTFEKFKQNKEFGEQALALLKGESGVSTGERMVFSCAIEKDTSLHKLGFFAFEGTGSILEEGLEPEEYEVIDVMPNGQIRMALYDQKGNLKSAANPKLSFAGKPAKCLWCHERIFQPLFSKTSEKPNYQKPSDFIDIITKANETLESYRSTLDTELNYNAHQSHARTEILYIGFDEPSAYRLCNEWELPINEVQALLEGLPTHKHHEFPFLGELYHRKTVQGKAPFECLQVPNDPRELSEYEPNFLD